MTYTVEDFQKDVAKDYLHFFIEEIRAYLEKLTNKKH